MAYVITAIIKGGKYFVQEYEGGVCLSGLINFAKQFKTAKEANRAIQRYSKMFKPELSYEVLPNTGKN